MWECGSSAVHWCAWATWRQICFVGLDRTEVYNLFFTNGRFVVFLVHSRAKDKIISRILRVEYENPIFLFNYIVFIACGLILFPSELFWIVISNKIVNSSMKFKFIHKIFVIQEKFLVFFNLLRRPDRMRSGLDPAHGPRVVHLCDRRL